MVAEHVDTEGAELREVDEQGVDDLEDRREGPLAQQHLNRRQGVGEESDGVASRTWAEDDNVEGQGDKLPARDVQELDFRLG